MHAESSPLALLLRAAAEAPAAPALAMAGLCIDYASYAAAVAGFAAQLAEAGAAGWPVALLLRNGLELPVAIFAAQAAGASACALNPDYTVPELAPMLALARPRVAVTHGDLVGTLRAALGDDWAGTIIALPSDAAAWLAGLAGQGGRIVPPDPDSIAVIQFTGGTTGRAKGVMLSHRAIAANVAQREAVLPTVWRDERIICMMPLFHSFASAMGHLLAANAAGCLHILPRYRPDWVLDCIEADAITRLPAGPTVFTSLLGFDGLRRERLGSLRCAWSGSAPLSVETLRRWEAATGVPVYEGYGQSEAGPILSYHGPGMAQKPGSVGPAVPGTEIAIVDVATGAPLPAGQAGEIVARGPQLMTGYLADAPATAAALRGGWLHTGDVGRIDADGYLFIEDRLKDMAIIGGYNVYPREVDEVLMACPGIAEAAAVAVADAYRGEVLWAFWTGEAGVDPERWTATRLVRYKRPARFVRVEALPRTGVGKIDKVALRLLATVGAAREGGS